MSLVLGTRLGPYEITAKLGEGGMGEVYRATDTRLDRQVAIKVLPAEFTEDKERLARFEREAKLLAQLHHPNIASIFGLEESDGTQALVMELVEGPTLAERLESGPLPFHESLSVSLQIAQALEEAHEKGIVHRDLKPQNIKASIEGKVKVLDFGLAKAMDSAAGSAGSASQLAQSPTLTMGATVQGVILGTAAYMAPEQAAGGVADRRADIWSFGVVLYEMLTGRRLFEGETVSHVLAGVLKDEPDFSTLPEGVPPRLIRLLRRCLRKRPRERLQAIGDARLELEEIAREPEETPAARLASAEPRERRAARWATWVALVAIGLIAGWALARNAGPGDASTRAPEAARLSVALPAEAPLAAGSFLPSLAFSPDGASLAYVAASADGVRRLAVRRLDAAEAKLIPGTEGAEGPFYSPDGEWIGFWSRWKLRKVRASGLAVPEVICSSLDFRGGTWAGRTIVFAASQVAALLQVDQDGGTPRPFTELQPGEASHRFPQALPDGDTLLFTAWKWPSFEVDRARLFARSLATGQVKELGATGHHVVYSPAGQLLYVQTGRLLAVPFDAAKLEIAGPAREILDRVVLQKNTGAAQLAVSSRGALVWAAGELLGDEVELARTDRSGRRTPIFATDTVRRYPKLSPDNRQLLVNAIGPDVEGEWLMSIDGAVRRRLRNDTNTTRWLRDGRWVYSDLVNAIYADSVDGSSPRRELLAAAKGPQTLTGSRSDGAIAYDVIGADGDLDSWILEAENGRPTAFLAGTSREGGVTFSPDGRYVAYISDRTGDFEVYVTSYPDRAATWQLSTAGGSEVVWRRDGKEIYFRSGSALMAVPVGTEPTFHAGSPAALFHLPYDGVLGTPNVPNFDAATDGSWFLMTHNPDLNEPSASVEIALDWPTVLSRR